MTVPRYVQVTILTLSFLSWFWLPWVISGVLILFAGLVLPVAAFALGVLADLLYYPGHGLPFGTLAGLGIAALTALVRYIAKTRIM